MHTSVAGGLEKAALRAVEAGANTFQIFSASPRMWRAGVPDPADVERLRRARKRHDLKPLVIHDNYLINLASREEGIRRLSIAAFRGEIERAMAIGADYLVAHPGSYKGQTLEEGMRAFILGLEEAASGLRSGRLTLLFENTAGAGCQIGRCFEELAVLRELVLRRVRFKVGFCLDTCHCLVSGYDVATAAGLRETVRKAEALLGLDNVPVIHANDSRSPLGSGLDRHQHIGEGYIGLEGFRRILNHPRLREKAFILETPVDNPGDELRNLEALKSLCRKSRTTTKKSS